MNKPEYIYILRDTDPWSEIDDRDIIAALSVKELIQHAVDVGFIEGEQMIFLDRKHYFLDEYLPTWKTELCLLSNNEFNEWFDMIYQIYRLPIL